MQVRGTVSSHVWSSLKRFLRLREKSVLGQLENWELNR